MEEGTWSMNKCKQDKDLYEQTFLLTTPDFYLIIENVNI